MMPTVHEVFLIDEDTLYDKSQINDYWYSVAKFYGEVKDKDVEALSKKQYEWLSKIQVDLDL